MKKWKEIINQKNVNAIRLLQYQILCSWFFSLNVHVLPSTMYQNYYKMNILLWYSYIWSTLMSICLFICTRRRICFDYLFLATFWFYGMIAIILLLCNAGVQKYSVSCDCSLQTIPVQIWFVCGSLRLRGHVRGWALRLICGRNPLQSAQNSTSRGIAGSHSQKIYFGRPLLLENLILAARFNQLFFCFFIKKWGEIIRTQPAAKSLLG